MLFLSPYSRDRNPIELCWSIHLFMPDEPVREFKRELRARIVGAMQDRAGAEKDAG